MHGHVHAVDRQNSAAKTRPEAINHLREPSDRLRVAIRDRRWIAGRFTEREGSSEVAATGRLQPRRSHWHRTSKVRRPGIRTATAE